MDPPPPPLTREDIEHQRSFIMHHAELIYRALGTIGLFPLDQDAVVQTPQRRRGISFYLNPELTGNAVTVAENVNHVRQMLARVPIDPQHPRGILELKVSGRRVSIDFAV